jgi:hypothetical protein
MILSMTSGAVRPLAACCATALLWLSASAAPAADVKPEPGLYEIKTSTSFGELPIPDTTVTVSSCVTQEDLDRDPQSLFAGNPAADNCTMDEFDMSNGELVMRLTCSTDDGVMVMTTTGSYDATSYRMDNVIELKFGDKKMLTTATVEGTRTGDCR